MKAALDGLIDRLKQRILDWIAFAVGSKIGQRLPAKVVEGIASNLPAAVVNRQPVQVSQQIRAVKQTAQTKKNRAITMRGNPKR